MISSILRIMFVVDNCRWFCLLQGQLKPRTSGHAAVAEGDHQLSQGENYANMAFQSSWASAVPPRVVAHLE